MIIKDTRSTDEKMRDELWIATTPYKKLLIAAHYGNLKLAKELLDQGTPVNPDQEDFVDTPLFCAARSGKLEMVNLLISRGATVNQVSVATSNETPLSIAASNGHVGVVDSLLASGAEVNLLVGSIGSTTIIHNALWPIPFKIDAFKNAVIIVGKLLAAKADPTIKGAFNQTPLEMAKRHLNSWEYILTGEEAATRYSILEKLLLREPGYDLEHALQDCEQMEKSKESKGNSKSFELTQEESEEFIELLNRREGAFTSTEKEAKQQKRSRGVYTDYIGIKTFSIPSSTNSILSPEKILDESDSLRAGRSSSSDEKSSAVLVGLINNSSILTSVTLDASAKRNKIVEVDDDGFIDISGSELPILEFKSTM